MDCCRQCLDNPQHTVPLNEWEAVQGVSGRCWLGLLNMKEFLPQLRQGRNKGRQSVLMYEPRDRHCRACYAQRQRMQAKHKAAHLLTTPLHLHRHGCIAPRAACKSSLRERALAHSPASPTQLFLSGNKQLGLKRDASKEHLCAQWTGRPIRRKTIGSSPSLKRNMCACLRVCVCMCGHPNADIVNGICPGARLKPWRQNACIATKVACVSPS
ncbi:hypothetical protein K470DRAFT_112828 [Piedraia hortae CBS 480.64]|uniref:Uncharacterized protein n=1 Tax=Piedraia hortae CBS 480.64 TaxID=1314780 RepID=A0A6A7BW88_9PEZI|nr:hypothetical protein K470DRAFT_112828 [Piedraia hortae CBS 480.64]